MRILTADENLILNREAQLLVEEFFESLHEMEELTAIRDTLMAEEEALSAASDEPWDVEFREVDSEVRIEVAKRALELLKTRLGA